MKKLTIIVVMLIVSAAAFGQSKFKFGVTAGVDLYNEFWGSTGYNAGFIGEFSFNNNLYTNASILYSNTFNSGGYSGYLKLPVHAGYKLPIANKVKIIGEIGPHLGFELEDFDDRFNGGFGLKLGVDISNRFRITAGEDWTFVSGGHYSQTTFGVAFFF